MRGSILALAMDSTRWRFDVSLSGVLSLVNTTGTLSPLQQL